MGDNNPLIQFMKDHRSIRQFKNKMIPDKVLNELFLCAQSAPTSHNVQAYSIIVIKDQEKKELLSKLCSDQNSIIECPTFLVFCCDFYRLKLASAIYNVKFDVSELENLFVGSIDATLAAGNLYIAAKTYGLGGVYIGDLRKNLEEVAELLGVPELVFPLFGMCLGYPNSTPLQKPRLPLNTVVHTDVYSEDKQIFDQLRKYDSNMSNYYNKRTSGKYNMKWTEQMTDYFSNPRQYKIKEFLLKQGFSLK